MPTMVPLNCPYYLGIQAWNPSPTLPSGRTLVTGSSTGSRFAMIVRVPKTGTIARVRFGVGTCTAVQDVKIALMDVTANSNFPDNTDDAYRDEPAAKFVSQTMVESGLLTHDGTDGGNMKAVVAGQPLAVTLRWVGASGTLVTPNIRDAGGTPQANMSLSYTTRWGSGGNWFGSALDVPSLVLIYADGTEHCPGFIQRPFANRTSNTHTVSSTPDEYGVYWQASLTGLLDRLGAVVNNSTSDLEWSVYDEASTVLARVTTSTRDHVVGSNRPTYGYFDSVPIERDSIYRFSVRPITPATNLNIDTIDITAGERASGPWGPLGCLTTRTNDGAWTETITKLPYYWLGFGAVEQP